MLQRKKKNDNNKKKKERTQRSRRRNSVVCVSDESNVVSLLSYDVSTENSNSNIVVNTTVTDPFMTVTDPYADMGNAVIHSDRTEDYQLEFV